MKTALCSTAGLCLAWCLASPAAIAQQADAPSPPPHATDEAKASAGIADIIVTAQRRSENLQRAAVAISAVSGDSLKSAGITKATELTSIVPALQVAPAAGPYNLFYLRGVGNFNGNAFSESAIAFNFAGAYIGRPSATTGFFYDLERVEVVKGPQGTLYGRNATGGAINVLPQKPELGAFHAAGSVEVGNYGGLRVDGMVNLPLGDAVAARFAAIKVRHEGYMNDGTDDQDDWGMRGSLRAEPTDNLSINIVADYFHQGGKGVGMTPLFAPLGVPAATMLQPSDRIGIFSPAGQAFYTSQTAGPLGRTFEAFPANFSQFQRNHWAGITATAEWRTELGTLTVVPTYRSGRLDFNSFLPGFQVYQVENSEQKSLETRFATPDTLPLRAILGAFYYDDHTDAPYGNYASNWNGQYDTGSDIKTTSKALFGRVTYEVKPGVRLNAGIRETWEDKRFTGSRTSLTRVCTAAACPGAPSLPYFSPAPQLGVFPSVLVPTLGPAPYGGLPDVIRAPKVIQVATPFHNDKQRSFSKMTWRAGADWDISSRNLLYASYETGFKAGGFYFSPVENGGAYDPETLSAYTLGSKNRFLGNRLQVNLELFVWKYKNQQISHLLSLAGVPTFVTQNVGRATFQGLELETRAAVTPETTLSADLQYLSAKYDSYVYSQANQNGGVFNGTSCPSQGFAADGSYIINCSGQRPPNAPEWTINFGLEQRVPVAFGEFTFNARAHYQTQTLTGLEFVSVERQPAYWLVDAQLNFTPRSKRFNIGLYVNNLFNETILSQASPVPSTAFYAATLRPPRTYGLRLGFSY